MKLEEVNSVYFVGIGGIGMSALARWFKHRGCAVSGYDRTNTPLTKALISEGIDIHFEDDISQLPIWIKDTEKTLVIYTPAIPKDHQELNLLRKSGLTVMKRSEVLGLISRGHFTIAVAGTHGKTTTSSIIAHLLDGSEAGCSAFVGGIMTNYESNLIIGSESAPVVIEADEFDRSFHQLSPDYSIMTSLDPDHLDIYGDPDTMRGAYIDFLNLTDKSGKVLIHEDLKSQLEESIQLSFKTYGIEKGDYQARNLRVEDGAFVFDYVGTESIADLKFHLPGIHNVTNAIAAITVALDQGMSPVLVKERIESYRGVKRRFEYIYRSQELTYIDDYAHHPTEIEQLLRSVRLLFPERRITTVFQPHLYTRTRDFQLGFAESLSLSDEVIMLPIYPAREEPIPGIESEIILEKIETEKSLLHKNDFPEVLEELKPEVLLTVGAGDIDQLVPKIKSYLNDKEKIEA